MSNVRGMGEKIIFTALVLNLMISFFARTWAREGQLIYKDVLEEKRRKVKGRKEGGRFEKRQNRRL